MNQPRISIFLSIFVTSLLLACSQDEPAPIELDNISVKELAKISYANGEALDLSGLVVTLVMNNGAVEDVSFPEFVNKGLTCTPSHGSVVTPETNSIVIHHSATGKNFSYPIVVSNVTEVSVIAPPAKVNYLLHEPLDLTGLIVKLTLENGQTREVQFHDFATWGITTLPINGASIAPTTTNVTITYGPNNKTVSQPVSIRVVTDLSVKMPPSKVAYYAGERLELTGLIITLSLDNGDSRDIPFVEFADLAIVTSPLNGAILSRDSTSVTIRHSESDKSAIQAISFISLTDVENNSYPLIKIGNQVWMQENLRVTKYQNGDDIGTTVPAAKDIILEDSPKYQWAFDGNENNVQIYGRLYTQYVAVDNRNVCPVGWRVPTENDFQVLTNYLINSGYNFDSPVTGNKIGKALASTTLWNSYPFVEGVPGNNLETNNKSGFTGVPSGIRVNFDNVFLHMGATTLWWSTKQNTVLRIQSFQQEGDIVTLGDKNVGAPIRCLKN